jgi:ABC-type transporter Mla subunit MlaD
VPSAANLVRGNEVRVGGARVGTVDRIEARRREDGTSFARLVLKLEKAVDPLPRDSSIAIRSKSALGLKYVQIERGDAQEGFADGATMPLSASDPGQVEFDEVINTFDDPTRAGIQGSLDGFGTALAGRGESLNSAIGAFRPLLRDVIPVAQNLSARSTDLRGLVRGLSRAAAEVGAGGRSAGRAVRQPRHDVHGAQPGRPALHPGVDQRERPGARRRRAVLPVQRPFLRDTASLFEELRPGRPRPADGRAQPV